MLKYKYENVNPKNRKTGDCSTRAIAKCVDISWETALQLQFESAMRTKYEVADRRTVEKVLEQFGYVKRKQPRRPDGKKFLVREMDQVLSNEELANGVVVNVANHYVCIKGDNYIDIWDSGWKTVGNYYSKENN